MTGKEIRKLRRSLDITQLQLGKMFGVSHVYISRIESDMRIGSKRKAIEAKLLELAAQDSEQQKAA